MKRYLFPLTLLALMTAILLGACGILPTAAPAPQPPLRVEYTQWWGDYTLLVAQEKGFFEKYNLDVELVYYPIFSEALPDLAAGQIDAAMIASGDTIRVNDHTPVRMVCVTDDGGYMPVIARPEITSIRDLKGKSIGTMVGSHYEMLVTQMLSIAQLTKADVTIRNINPEEVPEEMSQNKIQAAFVWEPFTTMMLQQGAHIIYPTTEKLRLFPDGLVFRKDVIDRRPQDIEAFLRAWFEAVQFRSDNPEATIEIASKYIRIPPEQIQPDLSLKIYTYQENLEMYAITPTLNNTIYDTARKTADYFVSNGILPVSPDVEAIITPEFLLAIEEQFSE